MTIDIVQEIALGKEVDLEKEEVVSEIIDNLVGHQVGDDHSDLTVEAEKLAEKETGQKVPTLQNKSIGALGKEIQHQVLAQRDCVMAVKVVHTRCGNALHCSKI